MENENLNIGEPEENLPPPVIEKIDLSAVAREKELIIQEEKAEQERVENERIDGVFDRLNAAIDALSDEDVLEVTRIINEVDNDAFENVKKKKAEGVN